MGLDITHFKATLQRPKTVDLFSEIFVTLEEYEGFDTSFKYFESSIQKIDKPIILKTLIFPKRENQIDEIERTFLKYDEYEVLFEKNKDDIFKTVNIYKETESLKATLLHEWETTDWFGFHFFIFEKVDGFYFEEVGYQRKGMNENLWTRFSSENTYNYTKKEDFEFALTCVDYYWKSDQKEEVENRRQLFKENFVDKYELNKSWISLCG